MSVINEILEWSANRPMWQRDALRRLVLNVDLSSADVRELAEVCKSTYGLTDPIEPAPLTNSDIPAELGVLGPVSLISIHHSRGVNALAENQSLRFSPKLTVVYGDNAAGKTGYIRILKSACHARGQEPILGNVTSTSRPPNPVVAIKYQVGTTDTAHEWIGDGKDDYISRVSVFDTQSAGVYLTEKTDVAFRPFGLDLFDKLVRACKQVRTILEKEQESISAITLVPLLGQVPSGTAVARALANVNSLTSTDAIRTLATLSEGERSQLALLQKSLSDSRTKEPEKQILQLELRRRRTENLRKHLEALEDALSDTKASAFLDAAQNVRRHEVRALGLRANVFRHDVLRGTGSEPWSLLWESAREFSLKEAYLGEPFPLAMSQGRCVLCQQKVQDGTSERLQGFETFVQSTAEKELRASKSHFEHLRTAIANTRSTNEALEDTLQELEPEYGSEVATILGSLKTNELRRQAILAASAIETATVQNLPALSTALVATKQISEEIDARVRALAESTSQDQRLKQEAIIAELEARRLLAQHELLVVNEIERRKRVAAYQLCIGDTSTTAITQKSTAITKAVVTSKLKASFRGELKSLLFRHVEVELKEAGGADGVLYHKLILTRAPGLEVPKVVSEGEQRCLAIAAFFAELSTADDRSGIVFDDPVSSLDYRWREAVARRLVEAARDRQVIVFTHDVVFLLLLKQIARGARR